MSSRVTGVIRSRQSIDHRATSRLPAPGARTCAAFARAAAPCASADRDRSSSRHPRESSSITSPHRRLISGNRRRNAARQRAVAIVGPDVQRAELRIDARHRDAGRVRRDSHVPGVHGLANLAGLACQHDRPTAARAAVDAGAPIDHHIVGGGCEELVAAVRDRQVFRAGRAGRRAPAPRGRRAARPVRRRWNRSTRRRLAMAWPLLADQALAIVGRVRRRDPDALAGGSRSRQRRTRRDARCREGRGIRCDDSALASRVVNGSTAPSEPRRRSRPESLAGAKMMSPPGCHAPPRGAGASARSRICASSSVRARSRPPAKNPIARPSGAQNGSTPSSVPGSGCSSPVERSRSQSCVRPACVPGNTSRRPSGASASPNSSRVLRRSSDSRAARGPVAAAVRVSEGRTLRARTAKYASTAALMTSGMTNASHRGRARLRSILMTSVS